MIPQTNTLNTKQSWQLALANCIRDPVILLSQLGLADKLTAIDGDSLSAFPLRVPHNYMNKMRYGDAEDPLLRQVFPLIDEGLNAEHFVTDPVGDSFALIAPGILQKYQGRTLLLTTGACAIHCRYCFRRHFPYNDSNPLASQWLPTLSTIRNDLSVNEIILSGGDPLMLSDNKLAAMVADLEKIPHLKRLRIHTRLPIVLPERIDQYLIKWLKNTRLQVIMVVHTNHANEIDDEVATALANIHYSGCQLLNQSVLLRGVNDTEKDLIDLSERLSDVAVMPYYLHLLDPVAGASHFNVPASIGIELLNGIRKQLPGYLVPRLVHERQGEASKTVIA